MRKSTNRTTALKSPLPGNRRCFRVTTTFTLEVESILIIEGKNAAQAEKRARGALRYARVEIQSPFEFDRGGIIGVSEPLDTDVVEVRESPDGMINLQSTQQQGADGGAQ